MIGVLYTVLGTLLLVKFSFDVARLRIQCHVAYGGGSFGELQSAIRTRDNAVEYIPAALVLLLFAEVNNAETWAVHICGLMSTVGRLVYYYRSHRRLFRWRCSGMSATWCLLLLVVLADLWYMLWESVFPLYWHTIHHFIFPGFLRYVSPRHAFFCAYHQSG